MRLDRRSFIGVSAAAAFGHAFASTTNGTPRSPSSSLTAKDLATAVPHLDSQSPGDGGSPSLALRFLGTGAIDWEAGPNEFGEVRRFTSALVDGKVLLDFTAHSHEMLPEGCRPEVVFYTHSHRDHFNAAAALDVGVKRVYCHETWADVARAKFNEAAGGRPVPEVTGLEFGKPVVESGVSFMALPANHSTRRKGERCAIYVVDKGPTRLLYATDTCGIPRDALKYAGLERDAKRPITAIVMEATAGPGHENDPRFFFSHSSVDLVARTVRALEESGRYRPPAGRPVWITHLIRSQYGSMPEIEKTLPAPIKAAYDGLEIFVSKTPDGLTACRT